MNKITEFKELAKEMHTEYVKQQTTEEQKNGGAYLAVILVAAINKGVITCEQGAEIMKLSAEIDALENLKGLPNED